MFNTFGAKSFDFLGLLHLVVDSAQIDPNGSCDLVVKQLNRDI